MRRALLITTSIAIAVITTIGWPARYALAVCVVVYGVSLTIANVLFPKRKRLWWRS